MDRRIGAVLINPERKLYARSGWEIPQVTKLKQDPKLLELRVDQWLKWKPDIKVRSKSPYPYNCVGMVFASRRAYIEIDHVYDILKHDFYHQISRNTVLPGDVVLYKDGSELTHVGTIIGVTPVALNSTTFYIQVLSKWGDDGEFLHSLESVPEIYGRPVEFWTERD